MAGQGELQRKDYCFPMLCAGETQGLSHGDYLPPTLYTGVVLDENFRPAYSAERGQTVYQMNLRNRGRRPKRGVEQKGADGV